MLSLILPTYNEAKNLPELLPRIATVLADVPHEVIVVDDDSPDKTWEIALAHARIDPRLRVIRRIGRRGLSSAVIEGFLAATGDVFVVMDADGQHDMGLVPKLYRAVKDGAGIALGSRYVEGGSVGQWDERRHTMSKIATKMALSLCKVSVTDPMSGFFAIGRKTFEQALPHLNPKGFKILLDLLIHVPADTVVKELPFTFSIRLYGESKLSRRVQIEFLEYLYEATIGHTIPLTLLQYCVVGTIGVIVNLGFYVIAADILSRVGVGLSVPAVADFSVAVLVGVEAAIVFNFLLNNLWTFAQARLKGMNAFVGFLKFNAACLFGAFANYAVTVLLVSRGFSVIESVAAGGVLGMIWNYTISRLFTWHV